MEGYVLINQDEKTASVFITVPASSSTDKEATLQRATTLFGRIEQMDGIEHLHHIGRGTHLEWTVSTSDGLALNQVVEALASEGLTQQV